VYRGTLGGRDVAVKVQRPGIAAQVAADAALLRTAAKLLEATGTVKASAVDAVAGRLFIVENKRSTDAESVPPAPPPPGGVLRTSARLTLKFLLLLRALRV
jgi:hypothetical protein